MTRRQRRKFTPEFKHEAVALVLDQGYSYKQASASLDLTETALREWVKQLKSKRGGATPKSAAMTAEQQKIKELETKVKRLERKKSILKLHDLLQLAKASSLERWLVTR
jgi:transposase